MTTQRVRAAWCAVAAVAAIAGVAWMSTALRGNMGFPLDDSWIHQVVARNVVASHTFGFTPGVRSSGSSSLLWTLLLAANYAVFPHLSPVLYTLLINTIALAACCVLLAHMARRDGLSAPETAALALLPALSGNLVWLAFTGMEHLLFLAFSLLAIALWCSRRPAVFTGLALGALALTRPEGVVLGILLLAFTKRLGRTLRDAASAAAVLALAVLASLAMNLYTSGSLMPATMRGRRFLYTGSDRMHFGRSSVLALTRETYQRILEHHFFHATGWWVAFFVLLALWGTFTLLRRFPNRTALLCLWAIVQYACYTVVLPAAGHGGRYQPFVLLLFAPMMAIGLLHLLRRVTPSRALAWTAVAAIAAITLPSMLRWQVALRDSIFEVNESPRRLALWINGHYPAGTVMAVSDIGAIGYFAHIQVVDLGGLVDPQFLSFLLSGRTLDYLDAHHVDYIVIAHEADDPRVAEVYRMLHNPAVRLVPIHTEGVSYARWESGNLYTQHGARFQTLYRIERVPPAEQSPAATEAAAQAAIHAHPDTEAQ